MKSPILISCKYVLNVMSGLLMFRNCDMNVQDPTPFFEYQFYVVDDTGLVPEDISMKHEIDENYNYIISPDLDEYCRIVICSYGDKNSNSSLPTDGNIAQFSPTCTFVHPWGESSWTYSDKVCIQNSYERISEESPLESALRNLARGNGLRVNPMDRGIRVYIQKMEFGELVLEINKEWPYKDREIDSHSIFNPECWNLESESIVEREYSQHTKYVWTFSLKENLAAELESLKRSRNF